MLPAGVRALKTQDIMFAQVPHQSRVFPKPFISSAPAVISGYGKGRSKCPVWPGSPYFLGHNPPDFFRQGRIIRRSNADVMGKYGCSVYIVVTVNRVNPVYYRYSQSRGKRRLLVSVIHIGPGLRGIWRWR